MKSSLLVFASLFIVAIASLSAPAQLYWDINDSSPGAGGTSPSGTWDSLTTNWNSAVDGTGPGTLWDSTTAIFSADIDATGPYTVTLSGSQSAAGLTFEDGTVTITGGTDLTLTGLGTIDTMAQLPTINSTIAGTVGLTKIGSGTLTLGGANTYTGGTILKAGTTAISANNNLGAAGGSLTFNAGTLRTDAALPAFTRNVVMTGVGTLNTNGFDSTFSGQFSGSGNFFKSGAGTLTLSGDNLASGFSGTIRVNAGKLIPTTGNAFGTVGTSSTSVVTIDDGAQLEVGDGVTVADRVYISGTGLSSTGAIHKVGSGLTIFSGGVTLNTSSRVVADAGTLRFTTGAWFNSTTPGEEDVTFAGAGNIETTSSPNTNISTAGGKVIKEGTGTLTLGGISAYSGGTVINQGMVVINADGAAGSQNLGTYPGSFSASNVIIDGGTLRTLQATSTARVAEPNRGIQIGPNGGTIDINANTIIFYRSDATTGVGGIIGAFNGGGTLTKTGVGELRYQGAGLPSTGYLKLAVKQGLFRLGFANSTSDERGFGAVPTVETTDAILLDGGTIGSSFNTTLDVKRGITIGNSVNGGGFFGTSGVTITVPGPLSGSGMLVVNGSATAFAGEAALSNANNTSTFTGSVQVNRSRLTLNTSLNATNFSGNFSGTSAGDLNLNGPGVVFTAGSDGTSTSYPGAALGTGSFTKVGGGTLTLNTVGTNEWTNTGGVNINGGSIKLGTAAAGFSTNAAITIAASASLDMNSIGDSLGGLNGAGSVTNHNATTGPQLTIAGAGTYNFTGTISGNGIVNKNGTGSQTFGGANSYSGGTTVTAGPLVVDGAAATLGTGNVTSTGGSLTISTGVSNAIADAAALNISGTGIVSLGTSINEKIGSLILGGATQSNGITYGSTTSSAMFQSDVYFSGAGIVTVGLLGDYNNNHVVDAADYVLWRMNPSAFGGDPAGYNTWRGNFGVTAPGSGSGSLAGGGAAVPEPTTIGLMILGLCTLATNGRGRKA